MNHPQGQCVVDVQPVRIAGDPTRTVYRLCANCRHIYGEAPFAFTLVPASTPEWVQRAVEHRLPFKVAA
jgi:hypothetical protein